jgi:predicted GTPase
MRWFRKWRRWRGLRRLERYLHVALATSDDPALTSAIDGAHALLIRMEAAGAITQAERLELGRAWARRYARARLPQAYRQREAQRVAELGWFLKAG